MKIRIDYGREPQLMKEITGDGKVSDSSNALPYADEMVSPMIFAASTLGSNQSNQKKVKIIDSKHKNPSKASADPNPASESKPRNPNLPPPKKGKIKLDTSPVRKPRALPRQTQGQAER